MAKTGSVLGQPGAGLVPQLTTPDYPRGVDVGSRSAQDPHQADTEQPRGSQGDRPADSGGTGGTGGAGGGGGGGSSLVRVTVNLAPRAVEALDQACEKTRDSKTDTINRALVVYNLVLELLERGGGRLKLETREGQTEIVHIL